MKTAILSVFDKTGIVDFASFLLENDYLILSSGGTYKLLSKEIESNYIKTVEEYTGSPEILGGRVKTLHPKISGGILATDSERDRADLEKFNMNQISLVVCNLYPFRDTVAKEHTEMDAIENIDIGGVTLIRAAFKNYHHVAVLTNPIQYVDFKRYENNLAVRSSYALDAMKHISQYDNEITQYFDLNYFLW